MATFKSCRNPTWPFIKIVESDVKVFYKATWGGIGKKYKVTCDIANYLDPCGALYMAFAT